MKNYIIVPLTNKQYDNYLLFLTHEGVSSFLESIEESIQIKGHTGALLIDQLLITGNNYNRFLLCRYMDGKLDRASAENITPDDSYRQLAVHLLRYNYDLVSSSILTKDQREKVLTGIPF